MKTEDILRDYARPEVEELTVSFENNILSGNMEDPDDPGEEIDI